MRTTSACFLGITCLLLHAAGCGSDPSPADAGATTSTGAGGNAAPSTTTGGPTSGTGGVTTGTGGGDACVVPTGGCHAPDQCGPTPPVTQIMQALPEGQGGTVEDGTYWITSFTMYTGPGGPLQDLNGLEFGGTFLLEGGVLHESHTTATLSASAATSGYSGTFVASGNTFTIDMTCGENTGVTKGSYTASGEKLTLYYPVTGSEMVLVKQ